MGRGLGSPNLEYRWEFILLDPTSSERKVVATKKFTSIKQMTETMAGYFTNSQLSSYASKSRTCPKIIEIKRICEPVNGYTDDVH
jgi:hypothetical protein|tara:strand:- start:380 stop:634 length:255 start_codon:yes stop_codon:yes gene_type:complete